MPDVKFLCFAIAFYLQVFNLLTSFIKYVYKTSVGRSLDNVDETELHKQNYQGFCSVHVNKTNSPVYRTENHILFPAVITAINNIGIDIECRNAN